VKNAGHSTVWVMPNGQQIDRELEELRSLGCNTSAFPGGILFAIDLPPGISASEIDRRFAPMAPQVAVAYPAWRHHG
jgi:hypothetical protein